MLLVWTCIHFKRKRIPIIIIIIGFTSNGEFNSLRWKGNTRPLTVLQVRSEARSKYKNKGFRTLSDMLTPEGHRYTTVMYVYITQCII